MEQESPFDFFFAAATAIAFHHPIKSNWLKWWCQEKHLYFEATLCRVMSGFQFLDENEPQAKRHLCFDKHVVTKKTKRTLHATLFEECI